MAIKFTRKYPMENEDEASPDVFLISEKLYGRHLVSASMAESQAEHLHFLAAALCDVDPSVIGSLDVRDYRRLTDEVNAILGKYTDGDEESPAPSSES